MVALLKIRPYTLQRGKDMLIPSAFYCLHAFLVLTTLDGAGLPMTGALPMYGPLKRCAPLLNLCLASLVLGKSTPTNAVLLSIGLMTGGAFFACQFKLSLFSLTHSLQSRSAITFAPKFLLFC